MLVALVGRRVGPAWTAGLVIILFLAMFTGTLFAAQMALRDRFGCITFFGEDFAAMYASASLVLSGQGGAIYDPTLLNQDGVALLQGLHPACGPTGPSIYWPAFLLPLFPLALLAAISAYYLWNALTLALFGFALWRLARASGVAPWPFWLIAVGFFPVISGLGQGQVHGLQFFALVEFWLALRRRADRSAGLWLSLQLVKFQFLPLILLYLAWQRRWRVVGWFSIAGLFWAVLSVVLAGGAAGVEAYYRVMVELVAPHSAQLPVSDMVNWHAEAYRWFSGEGYGFVGTGMAALTVLTLGLVARSWRQRPDEAASLEPQSFLVLIAGALLIGYDTHNYSLALLLAPALALLVELSGARGLMARLWSALMDFALLVPMVLLFLAFAFGIALPLGIREALLLGLVGLFLCGVFMPQWTARAERTALVEVRSL